MKKPELVVKTFYDSLNEGKILGKKCNCCGNYEFPPLYSCNECSAHDMEWAEMSGDAEVVEFLLPTGMLADAKDKDLMPYALGAVTMKEGPSMRTIIRGITKENAAHIRANMPYPAKAELVQEDGYKRIVFHIVEE